MKKKPTWTVWGTIVAVAIVAGALAGVTAAVFTDASLNRYLESLSEGDSFLSISEVKPDPVPGTYEEALAVVREVGWSSVALAVPASVDVLDASDVLGTGMIVTSDGWILFDQSTFEGYSDPLQQVKVWINGEAYGLNTLVDDTRHHLSLARINTSGLHAIAFGKSTDFEGGEMMFGIQGTWGLWVNALQSVSAHGALVPVPAEQYTTSWELRNDPQEAMPILDSSGELVAFVTSDEAVIPFDQIAPFITSVLRHGDVRYAGLGVYVLDLSETLVPIDNVLQEEGAFVAAPTYRRSAVIYQGPAALAGVKDNDVIVSVNGVYLLGDATLPAVLASYSPGDVVTLELLRGNETLFVDATLAPEEDLLY